MKKISTQTLSDLLIMSIFPVKAPVPGCLDIYVLRGHLVNSYYTS